MSIKVVVAVGNKKIERFIAQMDTIDVLTTIRRKEAVLDAIINYNPHVVVLSRELSGKIEMTDVIRRCRSLKEKCRVVFIYGEIDTEYKYFSYFLVQQGIYNILTGAVDAERLEDVIERVYTLEDIVGYQLNQENGPKKSVLDPTPNTSPTLVEPAPEKELEVLFVENCRTGNNTDYSTWQCHNWCIFPFSSWRQYSHSTGAGCLFTSSQKRFRLADRSANL